MKFNKVCLLAISLLMLGVVCLASMDVELSKLEGELEKLELDKAKRELANDIEDYLHAKGSSKKSVEAKSNTAEVKKDAAKEKKTAIEETATEDSLDDLVSSLKGESKRDAAEKQIRASLLEFLEQDLKKRAVVTKKKCQDIRSDCQYLKSKHFCESEKYKDLLKEKCALTCGHCDPCQDQLVGGRCKLFKKLNMCALQRQRMETLCFKTCGHCSVPAPPPCAKTTLGCCWDKSTAKVDKEGSNCPECKDSYKNVCKTFSADCGKGNKAGLFMRRHCPVSCQACIDTCTDDPVQADFCASWKAIGLCEKDKSAMKMFCKQTCGFC